jgi:hypothetical protein
MHQNSFHLKIGEVPSERTLLYSPLKMSEFNTRVKEDQISDAQWSNLFLNLVPPLPLAKP